MQDDAQQEQPESGPQSEPEPVPPPDADEDFAAIMQRAAQERPADTDEQPEQATGADAGADAGLEDSKRVRRWLVLGLGVVILLAFGLFGLVWWLLWPGIAAAPTPESSGITPEVVQRIEERLDVIEARLDRLQQHSADQTPRRLPEMSALMKAILSGGEEPETEVAEDSEEIAATAEADATGALAETDPPVEEPVEETAPPPAPVDDPPAEPRPAEPEPPPSAPSISADRQSDRQSPVTSAAADDSERLVLDAVRYGIQIGAFGLMESARLFAYDTGDDTQELYLFRAGPEGQMIAVIQGLYANNQDMARALSNIRERHATAWPRRLEPGSELTRFKPLDENPDPDR